VTQPFELTTRPADDIEIDPPQGRTQLRPIEVAVVEVHVRFWESPEEKVLRATRHLRRISARQVSQPGLADSGHFRALVRTFPAFLVSRSAA
jgi:hypothetical protein